MSAPKDEQRSEPETTQSSGKKVRRKARRPKRESLQQPRQFDAPGTEVRK